MRMRCIAVMLAGALLGAARGRADAVTYAYDDAGRLTGVTYANGASIAYTYDAAGNLLARTVTAAASGNTAPKRARGRESKPENSKTAASRQSKADKRTERSR